MKFLTPLPIRQDSAGLRRDFLSALARAGALACRNRGLSPLYRTVAMTPETAARVRESYLGLAPRADALVDRFFLHLFSGRPELRAMFPPDMTRLRVHLAASLAVIFRNIDCLGALEEPLMQLGARHAAAGVRPEHYPIIRDAMLAAIAETASPAWGHQLSADWHEALSRVSALILAGAAAAAAELGASVVTRPAAPQPRPTP
jgi:hemoglobin-like flavoprotein